MYFYVEKKGQWVTCNKLIYIYKIIIHENPHKSKQVFLFSC